MRRSARCCVAFSKKRNSMNRKWLVYLTVPLTLAWVTPAGAVASAKLYQSQAYVYGRFEARIQFAPGNGVVSSFFLWKAGSEVSGAYWNELDFEKLGVDCHLQTNVLYGTAPVADHAQTPAVGGDLCAQYHTYAFEWTPTSIGFLVDGVETRRETGAAATAFAQNATAGMQMHFNIWPGDASFGGIFDPAVMPVRQYISWVQYLSYANDTFTLQWREEFNSTTLPSGWFAGNWASPKNLSTHTPANVGLVGGIAVLSLTADGATGFTGVPPANNATGGTSDAGAGGTGTGTTNSSAPATGGLSAGAASAIGGTAGGGVSSSSVGGGASFTQASSSASGTTGESGCSCKVPAGSRAADGADLLALVVGTVLASRRQRRFLRVAERVKRDRQT
jgi:endo-1,3-1,4-beta-glycanase ExoK